MRIQHLNQAIGILVALGGTALLQAASTIPFSASTYSVAENAGTVTLTVQRTYDVDTVVSVDYACADGTAANGLKYTAVSGTLPFGAGETNKDIVVPILNDAIVGSTTTFKVMLSNPSGGAVLGTRTTATVQITDNDKGLAFEFANYAAREDEGSVLIGVTRGDDGDFAFTVDFSTANVSAQAGLDYTGVTNTLSFAAGERVTLFTVPILNDGLNEPTETFRLTLSNPTGGAVLGAPQTVTVAILANDLGVQFVENQLWVQEREGSVQVTVTRGNDLLLDPFTVDYATTNGTALAGTDYAESKGTLDFGTGEMTRSFSVRILDDGVAQKDRQFKVVLSNPTGGLTLGPTASATATVTVCDTSEMLPHRFESVQALPDGTVSLTLGAGFTPGLGISNRFQPFFDIYRIEASQDLIQWSPLVWLVRTNASANALVFTDPDARQFAQRFYRMPTNYLIAPSLPPTGPYAVGRDDRLLADSTRRNRYRISTNGSFMASIWCPAAREAGQLPTLWDEEPMDRDPRFEILWVDRYPDFHSYSVLRAPFATNLDHCPVVLFSHGRGSYRNDALEHAENLARHGFVVVAVDHFDCVAPVFPDGRYMICEDTTGRDVSASGLADRVQDLAFVMGELEKWNQQDALFAGRLELQKVATIGWSWGGFTAAEFCRVDPRCQVAIPLDPGGDSGALLVTGLQKPILQINRSDNSDTALFSKAAQGAIWFQISSSLHGDFGANSFYYTGGLARLPQLRDAARTVNAYVVWFLNKHLKGSVDPMPALKDYPRVINVKQK